MTALGYLQGGAVLYELEDPETQLGRAESNDIVLKNSRSISSVHARIVIHPRKRRTARLVDLNSMNGSFVNENRVHNDGCPLSSGDVLRFGYDQDSYRFFFPEDLPKTLLDPAAGGASNTSAAMPDGDAGHADNDVSASMMMRRSSASSPAAVNHSSSLPAGRRSGLFSPSSGDGTRYRDLAGSGVAAALNSPPDRDNAAGGDADSLNRSGYSSGHGGGRRGRSATNSRMAVTGDMTPAGIPSRRSPTVGRSLSPYDGGSPFQQNDEDDDIGRARSSSRGGRRPLSASAAAGASSYNRSPLSGSAAAAAMRSSMPASSSSSSSSGRSPSSRSLGPAAGGPPWRDRAARRGHGESGSIWGAAGVPIGGPGNNEDIPVTIAYPTAAGNKVESPTADRLKKLQEQRAEAEAAMLAEAEKENGNDDDDGDDGERATGALGENNHLGARYDHYRDNNNSSHNNSHNVSAGATGQSFFQPQHQPPSHPVYGLGSSAGGEDDDDGSGTGGRRAFFDGSSGSNREEDDEGDDDQRPPQQQQPNRRQREQEGEVRPAPRPRRGSGGGGGGGGSGANKEQAAAAQQKPQRGRALQRPDDSNNEHARASASDDNDNDDDDRGSRRSGSNSSNGVAWTVDAPAAAGGAGAGSKPAGFAPPPLRSRSQEGRGRRQSAGGASYGSNGRQDKDNNDEVDERGSRQQQQQQQRPRRASGHGGAGGAGGVDQQSPSPGPGPVINITAHGPVTLQTTEGGGAGNGSNSNGGGAGGGGRVLINGADVLLAADSNNNNNDTSTATSKRGGPAPPPRASGSNNSNSRSNNGGEATSAAGAGDREADALRAELASLRASMAAQQPPHQPPQQPQQAQQSSRPQSAASAASASPTKGAKSPKRPASAASSGASPAPTPRAASKTGVVATAENGHGSRQPSSSRPASASFSAGGGGGGADSARSDAAGFPLTPNAGGHNHHQQLEQLDDRQTAVDGDARSSATGGDGTEQQQQEQGEEGVLASTISSRLKDVRVPDTSEDGMGMGIGPGRAALSALSMRQPGEKGALSGNDMRNSLRWAATLRSPAGPNGVPLPPASPGFGSPGRSGRSKSARPASAGAVEGLLGSAGKSSRRSSSATNGKGSAKKSGGRGGAGGDDAASLASGGTQSGRPSSAPPQLQGLGASAFLTTNDQPAPLTLTARAPFDGPLSAGPGGAEGQLTAVFTPAQAGQQPVGTYPPGQSANAAAPPLLGGGTNANNSAGPASVAAASGRRGSIASNAGTAIVAPTAVQAAAATSAVVAPPIPTGAGTITSTFLPSLEAGLEPQVRSKLPPGQARELALSALLRTREEQLRRVLGGADNEIISLAGFAATGMPAVKDNAVASGDATAAGMASMAASSNAQYQNHLLMQQQQQQQGHPYPQPPPVPGYAFSGGGQNQNQGARENNDNASVVSGGFSTIGGMGFGRAFGGPSNLTSAARRGSFSTVAAASGFGGAPASVAAAGGGAGARNRPWSADKGSRAFGSPRGTNNTTSGPASGRPRSPPNGWGSYGTGYGGFGGDNGKSGKSRRPGSPGDNNNDAPHTPTGGELVTIPIDIDPAGRGFYPPQSRGGSRNGRGSNNNGQNSPGSASAFGAGGGQQYDGPPLTAAQERANLLFQAVNEEAPEDPVLSRMVAPGLPLPIPSPQATKGPLHLAAAQAQAQAQQQQQQQQFQAQMQMQQQHQQQQQQQAQGGLMGAAVRNLNHGHNGLSSAFQSAPQPTPNGLAAPPLMIDGQSQAPPPFGSQTNSLSSKLLNAKQYRMAALGGLMASDAAPMTTMIPLAAPPAASSSSYSSSSLPLLGAASKAHGGGSVLNVPLAYQQQQQRHYGASGSGTGAGALGQGHLASTIGSGAAVVAGGYQQLHHQGAMPAATGGARPLVSELASRPALPPSQKAAFGLPLGGPGMMGMGMGMGMGVGMAGPSSFNYHPHHRQQQMPVGPTGYYRY